MYIIERKFVLKKGGEKEKRREKKINKSKSGKGEKKKVKKEGGIGQISLHTVSRTCPL